MVLFGAHKYCMNIYTIRQKTAYNPNTRTTEKQAMRNWLIGKKQEFQFAVTLTIKQTITVKNDKGTYKHRLKRNDVDGIAERFTQKLNEQVFGHSAKRHKRKLLYIPIVEGVHNGKNLHLHFAIGHYPKDRLPNHFPQLVQNAITLVTELDEQHKVDVMDSGWFEYITKELSARNTDNVLWHLA